jgi:hypothetical protein
MAPPARREWLEMSMGAMLNHANPREVTAILRVELMSVAVTIWMQFWWDLGVGKAVEAGTLMFVPYKGYQCAQNKATCALPPKFRSR